MNSIRPVLLFLFSYLAGYLVLQGDVRAECHNDVANAFVVASGYIIVGITSVASLVHAFKHPGHPVVTKPIEQETKAVQSPPFDPDSEPGAGTPPSSFVK